MSFPLPKFIGLPLSLFFVLSISQIEAQQTADPAEIWADSIIAQMDDQALLGQLIMLRAHSNWEKEKVDQVADWVEEYQLGGLCFFQGGPGRQINLVNRYQQLAKVPLFIAMDAEWGLAMRLDSTIAFPFQMALGAIRDNDLIFDMGKEIGHQLRRVGAHINFAPVVDVNNNAANPVINFRSFGENRYEVTAKAYQYIKGMEAAGVLACLKHFPGHGDTEVDSHVGLPVIPHPKKRLDSLELYPFSQLAQVAPSLMVAHLQVPSLDAEPERPTTLSAPVISDLLRLNLGYDGLVFTDAMDMGGVTRMRASGQAEAEALVAGNDMVLLPLELDRTMDTLKAWLTDGRLKKGQVLQKVKRVLVAKHKIGLTQFQPISPRNLEVELNQPTALHLKKGLFDQAITLMKDDGQLFPMSIQQYANPIHIQMGGKSSSVFRALLKEQVPSMGDMFLSGGVSVANTLSILGRKQPDLVVVSLQGLGQYPRGQYGLKPEFQQLIRQMGERYPVIVVLQGNPYIAAYLEGKFSLLCAYQSDPLAQRAAVDALLGKQAISGKLPVSVGTSYSSGSGLMMPSVQIEKP